MIQKLKKWSDRHIGIRFFSKKKEGNPRKRYPTQYSKTIWVDQNMYKAIVLVSKIERISIKKAARMTLHAGFGRIMGKKLVEHIINEKRIREMNIKRHPYPTPLVKELRRLCKELGIDHKKVM